MMGDHKKTTGPLIPLTTTATLENVRVLLVEDDTLVRASIQRILEGRRAVVDAVASAREAVAAFEAEKPDVIVSDIGMPEESGHTLMRRLRALESPGTPRIPAVALTGHRRAEDRLEAVRAGFQIHVSKPVDPDELLTIIATFAGRIG
jgi:CheY-like chemotaxis protein